MFIDYFMALLPFFMPLKLNYLFRTKHKYVSNGRSILWEIWQNIPISISFEVL